MFFFNFSIKFEPILTIITKLRLKKGELRAEDLETRPKLPSKEKQGNIATVNVYAGLVTHAF